MLHFWNTVWDDRSEPVPPLKVPFNYPNSVLNSFEIGSCFHACDEGPGFLCALDMDRDHVLGVRKIANLLKREQLKILG